LIFRAAWTSTGCQRQEMYSSIVMQLETSEVCVKQREIKKKGEVYKEKKK